MSDFDALRLDVGSYEERTCALEGRVIAYRAWEGLRYCSAPVDPIQKLNLFVPECLYDGTGVYSRETAPIFMPNAVGGYMSGHATGPVLDPYGNGPNVVFSVLEHGYVVVSVGVRGRMGCSEDAKASVENPADSSVSALADSLAGKAPAFIVDYKVAIRWIRHNADVIPGCVNRIVTNGTSAGGALSALAGATGNVRDYKPYLAAMGALDESDDIFAASCYCSIHNLENSDFAYEWLFCGHNDYHPTRYLLGVAGNYVRVPESEMMTPG